jgi:hypothetical protein
MFIACNTSGEEGSPHFALIELTPEIAAELLKYRSVVEQARKFSDRLHCVEYFESRVTWGDTNLDIGDAWVRVPSENAVHGGDEHRVCAETIKITSTGVLWSASPKHSNGYFETEELAWDDIDAVAAGNNPFKLVE